MISLNRDDVDALRRLLIEALPLRILQYVSERDGQRSAQLIDAVIQHFPSGGDHQFLSISAAQALEWFVDRGDVYLSRGGRVHISPPFVSVSFVQEGRATLPIFGDIRAEEVIAAVLAPLGGELRCRTVQAVAPETGQSSPIGLERYVEVPTESLGQFLQVLDALGISVIDPDRLSASLPAIDDLMIPAPEHFGLAPGALTEGWEAYRPEQGATQGERWSPVPNWASGQEQLLRWQPEESWRTWERRYFLHRGGGIVVELTREESLIWQFAIDRDARLPLNVSYDAHTGMLSVGGLLPSQFAQWLRLLTGAPPKRIGRATLFPLPASLLHRVVGELRSRMGLRVYGAGTGEG